MGYVFCFYYKTTGNGVSVPIVFLTPVYSIIPLKSKESKILPSNEYLIGLQASAQAYLSAFWDRNAASNDGIDGSRNLPQVPVHGFVQAQGLTTAIS